MIQALDVVDASDQNFGDTGRGIAEADLDDLRRMTAYELPGKKVAVLGDDEEPVSFGEPPDALVIVTRVGFASPSLDTTPLTGAHALPEAGLRDHERGGWCTNWGNDRARHRS